MSSSLEEVPAKPGKPLKVSEIPLEELYANPPKGKHTPSVMKQILLKEDFTQQRRSYCQNICHLPEGEKCLDKSLRLRHTQFDVVVLQDFSYNEAQANSFQSNEQMQAVIEGLIGKLAIAEFKGLKWVLLDVMKCRPLDKKITDAKVRKCSPYIISELEQIKPKVVIVIGRSALKIVGSKASYSDRRGEIFEGFVQGGASSEPTNFWVVPTIHPKSTTYIRQNSVGKFWGPDYLSVIQKDFRKAARIAKGDLTPQPDTMRESIIRELYESGQLFTCMTNEQVKEEAEKILALPPKAMLAFDTETTSLDSFALDAKLLTIQFCYRTGTGLRSVTFPLWHRENKETDPDMTWELMKKILLGPNPKFGHNTKFDCLFIRATTGVKVVNVFTDTMFLIHAHNSGIKGCYGLKKAVWDYLPESGLGGYEDALPKLTKLSGVSGDDEDGETVWEDSQELPPPEYFVEK